MTRTDESKVALLISKSGGEHTLVQADVIEFVARFNEKKLQEYLKAGATGDAVDRMAAAVARLYRSARLVRGCWSPERDYEKNLRSRRFFERRKYRKAFPFETWEAEEIQRYKVVAEDFIRRELR